MLPYSVNYFRPKHYREALELLNHWGDRAKLLAGGTDLILAARRKELQPEAIVDISRLPELRVLDIDGNCLHFGGGLTFKEIHHSLLVQRFLPGIAEAASQVGSPQIRNLGTLGGNIVTASPAGDMLPPLSAYEAEIILESVSGQRRVSINALLRGKEPFIQPFEILREVQILKLAEPCAGCFVKLGRRNALATSRISCALVVSFLSDGLVNDARLAIGAVAPYPLRVEVAERIIIGSRITSEIYEKIVEAVTDAVSKSVAGRISAPYKNVAIRGVTLEALERIGCQWQNKSAPKTAVKSVPSW
ncbi:MAG: FAD binding domain-containing protein [Thermodesulfobacteriota bacterium]|jgi:carbon-monoxide dehydrogenase medium subunit